MHFSIYVQFYCYLHNIFTIFGPILNLQIYIFYFLHRLSSSSFLYGLRVWFFLHLLLSYADVYVWRKVRAVSKTYVIGIRQVQRHVWIYTRLPRESCRSYVIQNVQKTPVESLTRPLLIYFYLNLIEIELLYNNLTYFVLC